jgi:predicted alpha/beta-hydrolase family hydrolase
VVNAFREDCDPPVRGFLHRPATPSEEALVLTHGAGSNCQAPLLIAIAEAFVDAGFTVLRSDLPYRQKRPHGPPFPGGAAEDRAGLRNAVESLRKLTAGQPFRPFKRMFLGGHSYGGRQATMLAAQDEALAGLIQGLLLLSYPLHPPCKPADLRTNHFPALRTQALFVHGTRDPFGSLEEMERALKLIPARTSLIAIEGAGHDLLPSRRRRTHSMDLPKTLVAAFRTFVGPLP